MKVSGTGGIEAVKAYTAQLKKDKTESKDKAGQRVLADSLEISSKGKKIQYYKEILDKMPEIREELVASLKKRIQDGTYQPDSEKIADGIIRERFIIDKLEKRD